MDTKYILTDETRKINGHTLHRIQAARDIEIQHSRIGSIIRKGTLGGWVESEFNLSHAGACWVYDEAAVYGDAQVLHNASINGDAQVYDSASVSQTATVCGEAKVYDHATVTDNATVRRYAQVYGRATVRGDALISDSAVIAEDSSVYDDAIVCDHATVRGYTSVYESACIYGDAVIDGDACAYGRAKVWGRATDDACVSGSAFISSRGKVGQDQRVSTAACVDCDITDRKNIVMNLIAQTGLAPLNGVVTCYKLVNPDLSSFYDSSFIYKIGEYAEAVNPDMSDASCSSGLHFSLADYWMDQEAVNTLIIAEVALEDIITIQSGKIRCKRALIKGKLDL